MIPWLSPNDGLDAHAVVRPSERRLQVQAPQPARDSYRRVLSFGPLAMIEDGSVPPEATPAGYCAELQVILTYEGLFAYHVGARRLLVDSNQILLVGGDEEWRDEHPLSDVGHAAIVITPQKRVLDELRDLSRGRSKQYESATRLASPGSQLTAHRLLFTRYGDSLGRDEAVIAIVDEALSGPRKVLPSPRHVDRAKELLQAFAFDRVRLDEMAREIGLSPIYLTQLFKQSEGVPLYQYQLQLRLNHALRALPSCDDITALALELGFSSHSHFTAAFRSSFAVTPSQYRAEMQMPHRSTTASRYAVKRTG